LRVKAPLHQFPRKMPRYNPGKVMRTSNYRIQVTADSLDVECRVPLVSSRFPSSTKPAVVGGFFIFSGLGLLYLSCFVSGRNPSLLVVIANSRPGSADFVIAILALTMEVFLLAVGIRYFLPFCERLHCDGSTLTWSKIPWVCFGNRRVTRSVPVSEIVRVSYAIVHGNVSGSYYGILLEPFGSSWKMFWGIESPEANRILIGLKALGINVHHDPEMRESIREKLRDRRAEL
jgi:hypothetical protein